MFLPFREVESLVKCDAGLATEPPADRPAYLPPKIGTRALEDGEREGEWVPVGLTATRFECC
jgi:hypothetical protein